MNAAQPEPDRGHSPQPSPVPLKAPPSGGQIREVPIPIAGIAWPMLKAAFPLSEDAWKQMIDVLTAMKPGLVEPKKDSAGGESLGHSLPTPRTGAET